MSNDSAKPTNTTKAPSHIAYQVRKREGQKNYWNRIGAAWPTTDGKGFNIQLDSLPMDGFIKLYVPTEKSE